jgi:hypothetical protein
MKLTQTTVQILKHYSTINPGIVIHPGNILGTTSQLFTIVAKSKTDQEFDRMFAIYDLNRFLGALSLFNDPDIELNNSYLTIRGEDRELNYMFADPKVIMQPPPKFDMPPEIVRFRLTASTLSDITKGLSIMGLPELAFVGDGSKISVHALNTDNPSSGTFKITNLGETDKTFKAVYKIENIKIMPMDYDVSIGDPISHFVGNNIEYWIAVDMNSNKKKK